MKLWGQAGRGQSLCFAPLYPLPPLYLSLRHVQPTLDYLTHIPLRHGSEEQPSSYPHSSCFAPPLFFIKLPKQQSGSEGQLLLFWLADPAIAAPSSPHLALLVVRLSSTVSTFSHFQERSLRGKRSHRKTKTENELSCFIIFIDG